MRVAVVMGGPSPEAEVSRASARAVARGLEESGHTPTLVELTPAAAVSLGAGFDVVFPLVHGVLGEDGCLQGLLELLGVPYVGSGVLASALAMDKVAAKRAFRDVGLPVAKELVATRETPPDAIFAALGSGVVVKPRAAGSAAGVSRIQGGDIGALVAALTRALCFGGSALCEELVVGRELTCGVTDLAALTSPPGVSALAVTEIVPRRGDFYDFASKYGAGGSDHVCPAELDGDVTRAVQAAAVLAHRTLGCRDLSRSDFLLRADGSFVILETNTLPGMTATSLYPEAMAARGVPFASMCDALVRAAAGRGAADHGPVLELPT